MNSRERLAARRVIAGQVISVANLIHRRVLGATGAPVGRVNDLVALWDASVEYPRVAGVLVGVGRGEALVAAQDMTLEQARVRVRTEPLMVTKAVRTAGAVALAHDILDHQLVDLAGVQVVRAADIYVVRVPDGWEVAGVDVGPHALLRRLLPKRRTCPMPDRALDWADLHAFLPRFTDATKPGSDGPAASAGVVGGSLQLGAPATQLHKLRGREVAAIIADLDRRKQAQLTTLAAPSAAAEALRQMEPAKRDALLAELSDDDRLRLLSLLREGGDP